MKRDEKLSLMLGGLLGVVAFPAMICACALIYKAGFGLYLMLAGVL